MRTCVFILLLLAILQLSEARLCYNCTGDCVTDSECKGSCTTSVPELGDGHEIRSCQNETVEARCISEIIFDKRYKTCYCNTERCNSSSVASVSAFLFALVALLLRELR
ncbi:uncharacterized protein LOC119579541 [Penaeus monodon]|uniref:uncharacterized protein LOC119579541 n=1 Tax=Penaeus monodon TaxID=6687 RepID=UPI0018A7C413|nr:uncharacterized protein LOC119579541 [Penaeus monodon]